MNSKIGKSGAVVLAALLFGTALFVPVSSVKVENNNGITIKSIKKKDVLAIIPLNGRSLFMNLSMDNEKLSHFFSPIIFY